MDLYYNKKSEEKLKEDWFMHGLMRQHEIDINGLRNKQLSW